MNFHPHHGLYMRGAKVYNAGYETRLSGKKQSAPEGGRREREESAQFGDVNVS